MHIMPGVGQLIDKVEPFKPTGLKYNSPDGSDSFKQVLQTVSDELVAPTNPAGATVQLANQAAVYPELTVVDANVSSLKSQNWLMDRHHAGSINKPNIRELMDATGAEFSDASELLYGVIGSNADLRDWTKINASDNPVDAARAATNQLYNSDKNYAMVNHADYGTPKYDAILADSSLSTKTVISQAGNFAEIKIDTGATETMAVSSTGLLLRGAGSTQVQIERTAWLFGFNTKALFV